MQHGMEAAFHKLLESALQYLDGPLHGAELAVREALELGPQDPVRRQAAIEFVAPRLGEPERQAPAVLRIRLPLNGSGTHQGVD